MMEDENTVWKKLRALFELTAEEMGQGKMYGCIVWAFIPGTGWVRGVYCHCEIIYNDGHLKSVDISAATKFIREKACITNPGEIWGEEVK